MLFFPPKTRSVLCICIGERGSETGINIRSEKNSHSPMFMLIEDLILGQNNIFRVLILLYFSTQTNSKTFLRLKISRGKKGFVIPTKSFVKIGIGKTFCYNNKMFSSINKTFGCCSKSFGWSNKKFICCASFCCRNKTIYFRDSGER